MKRKRKGREKSARRNRRHQDKVQPVMGFTNRLSAMALKEFAMEKDESDRSCLFTSEQLAIHIVDTLVDHDFIDKGRFKEAVASVKWELDAQHGIGRIMLNVEKEKGIA